MRWKWEGLCAGRNLAGDSLLRYIPAHCARAVMHIHTHAGECALIDATLFAYRGRYANLNIIYSRAGFTTCSECRDRSDNSISRAAVAI